MNGSPRVGIKEVAEAAGVSTTTVSHALSGKGRLPAATRERVARIARDLGYRPHPAARSLAIGRTGLVATVVSAPGGTSIAFTEIDYYVALMNAATRVALARGYSLVVAPSTAGAETWDRLPLDGVIVIDPADGDETLPVLRSRGVAMVFVGRDPNGEPDDVVVQNDRRRATVAVLDHLVEAGARRPGLLSLRAFESFTEESLQAAQVWAASGERSIVTHAGDVDPTASPGELRQVAEAFLAAPERPDGVFCLYERLAVELLAAARERRLQVPRDLRIVTISEIGLAASTSPPLTTLDLEQARLGETAATQLADLLDGRAVRSVLDVPTNLTIRGSTAARAPVRSRPGSR
jgi:DNA-binding LacI/PurR family transcriptional regulator